MSNQRHLTDEQRADAEAMRVLGAIRVPGVRTENLLDYYQRARHYESLSGSHAPLSPEAYALQQTIGYLMDISRAAHSGLVPGRLPLDRAIFDLNMVAKRHGMQINPEESQLVRGTLAEEIPARRQAEERVRAQADLREGVSAGRRERDAASGAPRGEAPRATEPELRGVGEADRERLGIGRPSLRIPRTRMAGMDRLAESIESEASAAERQVEVARREEARRSRIAREERPAPAREEIETPEAPARRAAPVRAPRQEERADASARLAQSEAERAERATRDALRALGTTGTSLTSATRGRRGANEGGPLITEVGDMRVSEEGASGSAIRRRTAAPSGELGTLGRSRYTETQGQVGTGSESAAGPSNLNERQGASGRPARMDVEAEARRIDSMMDRLDSMLVSGQEHARLERARARLEAVQAQNEGTTIGTSLDPIQRIISNPQMTIAEKLSAVEAEVAGIERRFRRR